MPDAADDAARFDQRKQTVHGPQINVAGNLILPTPEQALHQLATPPADFTGRTAELEALLLAVQTGGATIAGLQGQGGIGKTALALVLADRLKDQFPDAQFFIDLRGASKSPLPAAEALAQVVRAFRPAEKLPESLAELQGLYRSVLTGQKALVLLDDARDRAQVAPFLPPPPGCLVLVTSRQHFGLPGLAEPLTLGTLPPGDARALVLRLAPRLAGLEGAATIADRMAALAGYLPLALGAAASALQEQVTLPPAEFVERLQAERRRLELEGLKADGVPLSVAASFGLSHDLLAGERQAQWLKLAVFPGTFARSAAAAVWAVEAEAGQDGLNDLVRHSLLEWNAEARRFGLHALARLYAASRLSDAERSVASLRHAQHYQTVISAADHLYVLGGDAIGQGLALFDQEWPNIQAGQTWAAHDLESDAIKAQLARSYLNTRFDLRGMRLGAGQHMAWLTAGVRAAGALNDDEAYGRHQTDLALVYRQNGEPRRALAIGQQALTRSRETNSLRDESAALNTLGWASHDLGESRRAAEYFEQALTLESEAGLNRVTPHALSGLGLAWHALGDLQRAMDSHTRYLQLARKNGNERQEGYALGNQALTYIALGDPHRAIELSEDFLRLARKYNDRRSEGRALGIKGEAHVSAGDWEKAIEDLEGAMTIASAIGDRRSEAISRDNLGIAYREIGEFQLAVEAHQESLEIIRNIGDKRREAIASWNLGLAYEKVGELSSAIPLMQPQVDYLSGQRHPDAEKRAAYLETLRRKMAGDAEAGAIQ